MVKIGSVEKSTSIYDIFFLLFILYTSVINDFFAIFPGLVNKVFTFSLSLLFCAPVAIYIFIRFFIEKKARINITFFLLLSFLIAIIIWAYNNDNVRQFAAIDFNLSTIRTVFLLPLAYAVEGNPKTRLKQLYDIAFPIMAIKCVIVYFNVYLIEDYMSFGYGTIIWCCFGIQYLLVEKRSKLFAIEVAICAITCLFLVLFANRGVVVVLIVFFIACFFTFLSGTKRLTAIVFLFACVAIVIIKLNMSEIVVFGNRYSRTVALFEQGNLMNLSGRDLIWKRCWEAFLQRPLFGYGYGYDRYFNGDPGLYAHNLILELLLNFGVVGTIPVLLCISIMAKHMITHAKSEDWKKLFLPYFVTCMVQLMVSSSLYKNSFFWCTIGLFYAERSFESRKN